MAPSPLESAPYFAWLSILTGGALTPSFCQLSITLMRTFKGGVKNIIEVYWWVWTTLAMALDKSCKECAASKDSNNDASSGFSIALTCTYGDTQNITSIHVKCLIQLKWISGEINLSLTSSTDLYWWRTIKRLHICSFTNFSKEKTTDFITWWFWRMPLISTNGCQRKIWTSQDSQYYFPFIQQS